MSNKYKAIYKINGYEKDFGYLANIMELEDLIDLVENGSVECEGLTSESSVDLVTVELVDNNA